MSPLFFVLAALSAGANPSITLGSQILTDSVRDVSYWASAANVIVRGTVIASEGYRREGYGGVYTQVTFKVTDVMKGSLGDSVLIFDVPGGTAGGLSTTISGLGFFPNKVGQDALLFLTTKSHDNYLAPRGLPFEVDNLRGGVIFLQRHGVALDGTEVPTDVYVEYIRLIGRGEIISSDSFLQSLPEPAPTPPTLRPSGGFTPADQTGRSDKPTGIERTPEFDTTENDTAAQSLPQGGEDSISKFVPALKSGGAEPAGPLSPPPQNLSGAHTFDLSKPTQVTKDKPFVSTTFGWVAGGPDALFPTGLV